MSFLFQAINSVNEKFKQAGDFNSDLGQFTGFTALDVYTSNIEHVANETVDLFNGGFFNNPYNGIGISSSGKTTFYIQAISSCMDSWYNQYGPVSECTFYNIELHTSVNRWKSVTGYTDAMILERVRFVDKALSINEIFNDILVLAKQKEKYRKTLEIDTGILSIDGTTRKILPTSYVLIDSIAAVRLESNFEFDKDGDLKDDKGIAGTNNMDAMQSAKNNTIFINEVKKLCESVSICLIMINHLVPVPNFDRYNPPKPVLPSMRADQRLKGGGELIYQSHGVYMLIPREKLQNEKNQYFGEQVFGLVTLMNLKKNKNGPENIEFPMVFDMYTGYKPELSDWELLWCGGMYGISGSPSSYRLDILPEISFTRKTLLQKCYDNPLLARAICFTARLKLLCEVILRQTPPSLKEYTELPYDVRLYLIMRYSMNYPGYVNFNRNISEKDAELYEYMCNTIDHRCRINEVIDIGLLNFTKETNGKYIFLDEVFDITCKNVVKLGGKEYIFSNKVRGNHE